MALWWTRLWYTLFFTFLFLLEAYKPASKSLSYFFQNYIKKYLIPPPFFFSTILASRVSANMYHFNIYGNWTIDSEEIPFWPPLLPQHTDDEFVVPNPPSSIGSVLLNMRDSRLLLYGGAMKMNYSLDIISMSKGMGSLPFFFGGRRVCCQTH